MHNLNRRCRSKRFFRDLFLWTAQPRRRRQRTEGQLVVLRVADQAEVDRFVENRRGIEGRGRRIRVPAEVSRCALDVQPDHVIHLQDGQRSFAPIQDRLLHLRQRIRLPPFVNPADNFLDAFFLSLGLHVF